VKEPQGSDFTMVRITFTITCDKKIMNVTLEDTRGLATQGSKGSLRAKTECRTHFMFLTNDCTISLHAINNKVGLGVV